LNPLGTLPDAAGPEGCKTGPLARFRSLGCCGAHVKHGLNGHVWLEGKKRMENMRICRRDYKPM